MKRKIAIALLFSLVLVMAGCSDSGVGDSPTDEPTTDEPTTDEPTTDEPTTDEPTTDEPDDWEQTSARNALESAGSYTSSWVWSSNVNDTEMEFNTEVDLTEERTFTRFDLESDGEKTGLHNYYADGVQYTRAMSEDTDDVYYQNEATFDDTQSIWEYAFDYESESLDEWTDEGTETYDGETVRRYVYTDATELFGESEAPGEEFDVSSARFEVLVDRDGVPRYQVYEVNGTDSNGEDGWYKWELTVTDIGSTTVEEPEWIDQARQ